MYNKDNIPNVMRIIATNTGDNTVYNFFRINDAYIVQWNGTNFRPYWSTLSIYAVIDDLNTGWYIILK